MTQRAARLADAFALIARTRMAGVPVLNPALGVEAVGFAPHTTPDGARGEFGVLVTPWFMNLIWLPIDAAPLAIGETRVHAIGGERFEFIGAHEPGSGDYALCSLFSPMFEFADQAAARATAQAVLATLRAATTPAPARRAFLLGRGAAA